MCLSKFREPTEEERNKIHIGYKIVKKTEYPNAFTSIHMAAVYCREATTISDRQLNNIIPNEKVTGDIEFGIHFYISPEVEEYPFEDEEVYVLIKVEVQGSDLVAFGEGPYPDPCPRPSPYPYRHPCRCQYPRRCQYRSQAVATKVKVLKIITRQLEIDYDK